MTEPIASAVASTVVVGVGAGMLAIFGLEPGPLFWAFVGSCIGMSFAEPASRLRATIVFLAVSLCCSLFGAWLAQRYFAGELLSRNALACGLSIFFHPLLNAAITRLPAAVDGALRKLGIGSQQ